MNSLEFLNQLIQKVPNNNFLLNLKVKELQIIRNYFNRKYRVIKVKQSIGLYN